MRRHTYPVKIYVDLSTMVNLDLPIELSSVKLCSKSSDSDESLLRSDVSTYVTASFRRQSLLMKRLLLPKILSLLPPASTNF